MDCVRYVFSYESSPNEVRDYIWKAIDFAEKTYGRDKYFSRFNQMLDQARFLGWKIPRFTDSIPEVFQDLAPEAIDHIFETQAKILVDVSPVSEVILENGKKATTRMICSTTPVGDLVWKTHFLMDSDGHPCIDSKRKVRVKIKGTKVVCNPETLPYDENLMISYFDIDSKGIWPVPFLPEFFSHHPLAKVFSIEDEMVEVVKIEEAEPVRVIAIDNVPWYRTLFIDRTKALPLMTYYDESFPEIESIDDSGGDFDNYLENLNNNKETPDRKESSTQLNEFDLEEENEELESELPLYTNVMVSLSESENQQLASMVSLMENSSITSKEEAKKLQNSEKKEDKERAESWLLTAVNRLALLANCYFKIGALIGLVQRHLDDQVLIIQPREKWAEVLVRELNKKGIDSTLNRDKSDIKKFLSGKIKVLVTSKMYTELLIDNAVVISVSAFTPADWLENLNSSHQVYGISVKELGLDDLNYLQESSSFEITEENYDGPGLSLLKDSPVSPIVKIKKEEPKLKYKVKPKKGKPASADSLEKAIALAKKKESKGLSCEIYDLDNNLVYVTNIGETV